MKELTDNLPATAHREIIGQAVSLPGRFDILTDGLTFPLATDPEMFAHQKREEGMGNAEAMVRRLIKHALKKLEAEGRNLPDCRVTVTVAVHHKGEATDFWIGDAPDRKPVSKALPEHLTKPTNGKRIV